MKGHLLKMKAVLGDPIQYELKFDDNIIPMNDLIGKKIQIDHTGNIHCIHCGRKTNKSFSQGYCYPCFTSLPQTDVGVIHPERNQAHLGISRDMEWAKKNDLIDHFVYLAVSSAVKVGVTRHTQIPTRWIDQGAERAIKLAKTPYRNLAGQIEVALKSHMTDKTNWRAMLTNRVDTSTDIVESKQKAIELLPDELKQYVESDNVVTMLHYPVEAYPEKVKSVNLDKNPSFSGVLKGIKGQYLIFDQGFVMNVRKYNGYEAELTID